MKPTILILLTAFALHAQNTPELPRLSGIINLPEVKEAVFEWSDQKTGPRQLISTEEDGFWGLKVLKISAEKQTVEVSVEGVKGPLMLSMVTTSNAVQKPLVGIELARASLHSILALYGEFSGKTLLCWPNLPAVTFTLKTSATNRVEIVRVLKEALDREHIAAVDDGDTFAMILPASQAAAFKQKAPSPTKDEPRNIKLILYGMPLMQVFDVYAEYQNSKFDHSTPEPKPVQPLLFLSTQSPLTRREALYALDTLLDWQGIKIVRRQDGLLTAVQKGNQ